MLDKLGTLLGMLFGTALVFFGIVWPDHLSNYYMYMFREFETGLETLKATQATSEELRNHKAVFKEFQDSWLGSVSRFADLKSFLIVVGGSYAATLIAFRFGDAMRAFLFIAKAFLKGKADKDFLEVYNTIIGLCEKRANKEIISDEEISSVKNSDLQTWLQDFIAVDLVTEEMIEEIVRSEIEMYNYRSFEEIDMLEFMGRAAPAFGMIGTCLLYTSPSPRD